MGESYVQQLDVISTCKDNKSEAETTEMVRKTSNGSSDVDARTEIFRESNISHTSNISNINILMSIPISISDSIGVYWQLSKTNYEIIQNSIRSQFLFIAAHSPKPETQKVKSMFPALEV